MSSSSPKARVLVIPGDFKYDAPSSHYLKTHFDVTVVDQSPAEKADLLKLVGACEALISRSHLKIDREIVEAGKHLKVIARQGAGYDEVDVAAAIEKGIWVTNTPNVIAKATADIAFAHLLNISRRFSESERWLRQGHFAGGWERFLGRNPEGKTLGILGMGSIGKEVAKRAAAIDMHIVYHNRKRVPEEEERKYGAKYVSKDELLRVSDYISVSVFASPETKHILNYTDFEKMKNGVYIINTSRGLTINEQALVDALRSGKVAGAGLDVFEKEPEVHPDLKTFPNVSLTPHIGTATWDTRQEMEELAISNVVSVLEGRGPVTPVPECHVLKGKL